jgi:acetyl esterase/lipase
MTGGRRRIGWLGWTLLLFAIVIVGGAIALFAAYRWSQEHHSVVLLDQADRFLSAPAEARRVSFGDDPAQHLLTFGSPGGAPKPILVFFHGGSWAHGTPDEYGFVARAFAPENYVVVLAGYRLGPAGRFPAMLEDGAAAVAWVHRHAAEFGGDPQRIFLIGHSAGAYNAAMLALDRQWLGREGLDPGIIKGMIGLAGPYDFLPFDDADSLNAFGHWPRPAATQPVGFARADAPPMLLATGTADTSVRPRNSEALARALTQAGAPVRTIRFPGMGHVGILVTLARPARWWDHRVRDSVLAFLAENRESAPASAPVQSL